MATPELDIAIRARRWSCVVDPVLALGTPLGAQLIQRLSAVIDLWVVRSFWQALDSSEFYRRDPLAFWADAEREQRGEQGADVVTAIRLWEAVRTCTDLGHCRLHWVSDNLSESSLADSAPDNLVERYEALHQALAARADPAEELTESAGFFGLLDALSLAAALGPVRVLTLAPGHPLSALPASCRVLDLPLLPAPDGALVAVERQHLIELLAEAGTGPLLWAGLPLAVAQVLLPESVPAALRAGEFDRNDSGDGFDLAVEDTVANVGRSPWRGARVYHYQLPGVENR